MTNQDNKVLDVMMRDGGITHLTAQHYGFGCVRKHVSNLRDAGVKILTVRRKDAEGNKYTRWTLAKMAEQPIAVQLRAKLAA